MAAPNDLVLSYRACVDIPVGVDANGAAVTKKILTKHGMITMERVCTHIFSYSTFIDTETQNA